MRRILIAALVLLASTALVPAPAMAQTDDVVGRWEGALSVQGMQLRLVLVIEAGDDGALTTTMYSPDQLPDPIETGETTFEDGELVVTVPMIQGRYEGTLNEEGGLEGTWSQGPNSLPLNMEKVEEGGGR